jgi:hypothetical protein
MLAGFAGVTSDEPLDQPGPATFGAQESGLRIDASPSGAGLEGGYRGEYMDFTLS